MALSLASITKSASGQAPPRILLYGVEGVGKTTLAAGAPSPVFLWTEEGAGKLSVDGFPIIKRYDDLMEAIGVLLTEDHEYRTVVLDSLDWLEPIVWAETCKRGGHENIESAGYGKGYKEADLVWREVIEGLSALRDDRGMGLIAIAHSQVKTFHDPERESYDRYVIKLHERASGIWRENVDAIWFANYRLSILKDGKANDKNARVRATGGQQRAVFCEQRAAFLAKNRYGMPSDLNFSNPPDDFWNVMSGVVPWLNNEEQSNG